MSLQQKGIEQWQYWLDPPPDKRQWIQAGFDNQEFYFVENEDQQVVGMFRLMETDELYWGKQPTVKARYIHSLVVDDAFAGQKIGQRIITKVISEWSAKGINTLRLDCNAHNTQLCQYYEQMGFVKLGEKQLTHSFNNLYEKKW